MSDPIPIFINEQFRSVAAGSTVRAALGAADLGLGSDLTQVVVTDGRGLPLDPDARVTAGAIIRAVRSARAARSSAALTRELIARMPKAELHVHLDGSLRPETMLELAPAAKVSLPGRDPEELRRAMLADRVLDLEELLRLFDLTVALLQTPEAIERVAYEMVEDAAGDGIRYLEVRYCPELSTKRGLSLDEAVAAEWRGLERGQREFGVRTGIINCSLRHYDPALSLEIARHSVRMRDHGVVGFDLAGGEAGRPPEPHGPAFDLAAAGGLGITVHAGEAAGPTSIRGAIERCHAMRIGHATRLYEDPALESMVRERGIALEINVTCNVQTHAVRSAADHPVKGYLERGLRCSLSSDAWLMCGTTLTDEYWLAHQALGFGRPELERMILAGFESAFLPEAEKRALVESTRRELAELP